MCEIGNNLIMQRLQRQALTKIIYITNIQTVMYESSIRIAVLMALSSSVQNNPTWNGPCPINDVHLAPTCTDA
jgi:hypothetical protein